MKKSKKIIFGALSVASTAAVVTPLITSCSNSSDIKKVSRGDGNKFATYKFKGAEKATDLSFEDVLSQAAASKDGFAAFKQQISKELIYNWYQGIKDSDKAPQSFKDNWSTWTDAAKKAYDDKVQSYKDSHSKSWEYYFQNEVLDPVGGTKDAFIRQQMYDKVYDAFKNLVFTTNYLAYTTDETPTVNSNISSFTEKEFDDTATWKKIGFYAKANSSYSKDSQDLDDVYAIIQQKTFDAYTEAKHPQALLMLLWKYAAPTDGMYTIYSTNIPATDEEKKNSNNVSANEGETTKTLKAKYETPGFPQWKGGEYTANKKFQVTVNDLFGTDSHWGESAVGNKYSLDKNGMFRYINQGSIYQDDGSTMGFVLNTNEMYSKLDSWFAPAVTELYQQEINMTSSPAIATTDNFLEYPVSQLLKNGVDGYVDILSNFFFRSNDSRLFVSGVQGNVTDMGKQLSILNQKGLVLDLSKTFEYTVPQNTAPTTLAVYKSDGTLETAANANADFHSKLFFNSKTAAFDYFGVDNDEGGVQFAVNALWLTDDNGNRLPYILFRDTNGVHLCGLYGAQGYATTAATETTPGFLADTDTTKYPEAEYGKAWSQGRQNVQLKALNLFMKSRNESLFDLSSEVKSYFTSNVDDIVIAMAIEGTKRGNTKEDVIFDYGKAVEVDKTILASVLNDSTVYFLLQSTLTSYLEANKKLYSLMSTHITNSLLSRSTDSQLERKTTDNYKNAMATPMPYIGEYQNSGAIGTDADFYTGYLSFPITNASIWINAHKSAAGNENDPIMYIDPGKDVWSDSFTYVNETASKTGTKDATKFLTKGVQNIITKYDNIIKSLGMTNATLPNSDYANWSEHLNPKYTYDGDKANGAVGNGLYMAINKYISGTQITNGIKLNAYKAYATSSTDNIFAVNPSLDNFELGEIKNDGTYKGLRDAVASMMYGNKVFTSDTPLSFYTGIAANGDNYFDTIEKLGQQSIAHAATSSSASDDLLSYWTFIDTLQYLVNDNYANLMKYLQTSVMSYGIEADLVWVAQDNRDANPSFLTDSTDPATEAAHFGWKANYDGKYSYTYLPTKNATSSDYGTPSTYVDNSAYYQAAPLKYGTGENDKTLGMGFAGLATSTSSPSVITSTLQNALFTDTYNSKTDTTKSKHYGGWFKYGNITKLEEYITKLTSVADIQKLATNLGAANKDADFTTHVLDVVKRTTFQDGDPELGTGSPFKVGQALSPTVLRNRLLGVKDAKYGDLTVNYVSKTWGLNWYCYVDPTAEQKVLKDNVKDLFTRFGGADLTNPSTLNGVAQELYSINSNQHAMRSTAEAATASNYARMMVIQLNNADFESVESLCAATTGSTTDHTLLNYLAVQYAQVSSLQNQATNDVIKNILGDDNKVTVYDRRLNDKLGPTWVKDYKSTN